MPREQIRILLDFVERGNKQDAEMSVAQAAQDVEQWLNKQGI